MRFELDGYKLHGKNQRNINQGIKHFGDIIYIYLHYINIISNHRGILRIPLRDAMIPKSLPDAAADAWPIAHP